MEEIKSQIKNILSNLLEKGGFDLNSLGIEVTKDIDGQEIYFANIQLEDNTFLSFDKQGEVLKSFEYIIRLILARKFSQKINLMIDINNFKKERYKKIIELARLAAKKVQFTKKALVLSPMPAYERRIIHLELSTWSDIVTESIGEEPRRRVVIKPYP